MVASRILCPATKMATTRLWHTSTLAQEFGVVEATEDDLYAAMDWLLAGQDRIQKKLAARHLLDDSLVLCDLSSSYFEGSHCPLAKLGYSRDGKRGTLQVNYGLLTDGRGCPVAISVHPGNTSDSVTFMPEVKRLREQFGIQRMVMVGDRGMISQKAIDEMSKDSDIDGSQRCAVPRFARWWSRAICRWGCSMSAICWRSARRTFPASVWWRVVIRSWPSYRAPQSRLCSQRAHLRQPQVAHRIAVTGHHYRSSPGA